MSQETLRKPDQNSTWQRFMLASSAMLLAAIGTIAHFLPSIDRGSAQFIAGTCWKIAVVLAITWLASPQIERLGWQRIRGSVLIGLIIVIVLLSLRPRIGAIAAVIFVVASAIFAAAGWMRRLTKP